MAGETAHAWFAAPNTPPKARPEKAPFIVASRAMMLQEEDQSDVNNNRPVCERGLCN
jgi:hypothetical protein